MSIGDHFAVYPPREPMDSVEVAVGLGCLYLGSFAATLGFCWALPQKDKIALTPLTLTATRASGACLVLGVPGCAYVASYLGLTAGGLVSACFAPLLWLPVINCLDGRHRSDKVAAVLTAVCGAAWPAFVWWRCHRRHESKEPTCMKCGMAVAQTFIGGGMAGLCHVAVDELPPAHPLRQYRNMLFGERQVVLPWMTRQLHKMGLELPSDVTDSVTGYLEKWGVFSS